MPNRLIVISFLLILLLLIEHFARWFLAKQILLLGHHLFKSQRVGLFFYILLFFPGTVIHELSHLSFAKLLGLKTAGIHLWTEKIDYDEPLGFVEVESGKPFRLTFVGIAPLIVGLIVLIATIYYLSIFGSAVSVDFIAGRLTDPALYLRLLRNLLQNSFNPIGLLLLYIAVSVSNHMYPSKADLRHWPYQILIVLVFGLVFYLLSKLLNLDLLPIFYSVAPLLFAVFIFSLILNLLLGSVFYCINWVLRLPNRFD